MVGLKSIGRGAASLTEQQLTLADDDVVEGGIAEQIAECDEASCDGCALSLGNCPANAGPLPTMPSPPTSSRWAKPLPVFVIGPRLAFTTRVFSRRQPHSAASRCPAGREYLSLLQHRPGRRFLLVGRIAVLA